jgi:hypothetical protein
MVPSLAVVFITATAATASATVPIDALLGDPPQVQPTADAAPAGLRVAATIGTTLVFASAASIGLAFAGAAAECMWSHSDYCGITGGMLGFAAGELLGSVTGAWLGDLWAGGRAGFLAVLWPPLVCAILGLAFTPFVPPLGLAALLLGPPLAAILAAEASHAEATDRPRLALVPVRGGAVLTLGATF